MRQGYNNQMPAGCEPADSRGDSIRTSMPVGNQEGTSRAPFSGIEYVPPTPTCSWMDYTCNAYPAKGTEFCIGHLRKVLKQQIAQGFVVETTNEPEQESDGT